MGEKKVDLIAVLQHPKDISWNPEDYASYGARGCFSQESSAGLHDTETRVVIDENRDEINNRIAKALENGFSLESLMQAVGSVKEFFVNHPPQKAERNKIFNHTSGKGHGSVLDQSTFLYSIDNLTRASTLFLCAPEYASHLQQSLRRATAERGYERTDDNRGNEIMQKQFDLYEQMTEARVPTEDARIILPLNTKTTIQSLWNARELMHLNSMSKRMFVPADIRDTVQEMYNQAQEVAPLLMQDRETNYEVLSWFPSSQLFAKRNSPLERIANFGNGFEFKGFSKGLGMTENEVRRAVEEKDEALLANLKQYHFSFVAPMSIMTFHQATRQRTWNQSIEPLRNAVSRGKAIVPPSIAKTSYKQQFLDLFNESISYVRENLDRPNAYGVIPHALEVYDAIHVNGWNALHSVGKRTCKTAQWEIRDIAKKMASEIRSNAPEIGKYSVPQGILYGSCPEKNKCGLCKK